MTTRKPLTITTPLPRFDSDAELELWLAIHADELPQPVTQYYFAKALKRRVRSDLAWPEYMLLVEVEGGITPYRDKHTGKMRDRGRHLTITGFTNDCSKYNLAAVLGYTVLRFTPAMVRSGEAVETIKAALQARRRAVA